MDDTLLILDGIGVPLYSARGLQQTLAPIAAAANLRRTVNGSLRDVSFEPFRRYGSRISCTDQRAPAVDGIWPGMAVIVHCVEELCYPVGGMPQRSEVSGSSRTEDGFVFYRPVLNMLVTTLTMQIDEYSADVQWSMDLEEV
jgi:hypothetical protein